MATVLPTSRNCTFRRSEAMFEDFTSLQRRHLHFYPQEPKFDRLLLSHNITIIQEKSRRHNRLSTYVFQNNVTKKAKGSYNRQPSPTIQLYHHGGKGLHVVPRMAFRPRDMYFVGDIEATASMECF